MISLREALAELRSEGYREEFSAVDGNLRARASGATYAPDDLVAERVDRIDVDTDAADQALVYGLRSARDGARGTYVAAFGPAMDPGDAAVVVRLARLPRAA